MSSPATERPSPERPPFDRSRIPALDGLRAVSIGLVLIYHFALSGTPSDREEHFLKALGDYGVSVFFVISGFLITWLLTRELAKTGGIDLRAFYVRRAYRIWPAYYALVLTVALLDHRGVIAVAGRDIVSASLFVWNYVPPAGDPWWLGHAWSLSMEEQFYLLWPACLLFLGARGSLRLALAIVGLAPVVRMATFYLLPVELRPYTAVMLHTRADTLMAGCALALISADPAGRAIVRRLLTLRLHLAGFALLLLSPYLRVAFSVPYTLPFGYSIEALATTMVLAWILYEPGTRLARLLDTPLLARVGVISFSLYLWQQLFARGVPGIPGVPAPVRLLIVFALAELSYRGIEQPFLRLRHRRAATPADAGLSPG